MILMSPLGEHVHCGFYTSKKIVRNFEGGFAKELKINFKK